MFECSKREKNLIPSTELEHVKGKRGVGERSSLLSSNLQSTCAPVRDLNKALGGCSSQYSQVTYITQEFSDSKVPDFYIVASMTQALH